MVAATAQNRGGLTWSQWLAGILDVLSAWWLAMEAPDPTRVARSLTLTEIGVIFSIVISGLTGAFTFGYLYGQVNNNTDRIDRLEPVVSTSAQRLERIDANVAFLTDLAKEERQAGRH